MRQNRVISLPVIFRLADGEVSMKVWLSGLAKSSHKFVFETAGQAACSIFSTHSASSDVGLKPGSASPSCQSDRPAAPAQVFSWHTM